MVQWTFAFLDMEPWDLNRCFDSIEDATRAGKDRARELGKSVFHVASFSDVAFGQLNYIDINKVIKGIADCLDDEYGERVAEMFMKSVDYDNKAELETSIYNVTDDWLGGLEIRSIRPESIKEVEVME